ncbi:hypothetical protein [Actinocrispum sp. NPDC049592]
MLGGHLAANPDVAVSCWSPATRVQVFDGSGVPRDFTPRTACI